jgi:murein DD-endopeptidase MepM/ murein hydrolase activator NlpD
MGYGNPVVGYIRPPGSPSIVGNFRVTAPFGSIDPSHPTPHGGVDIGNMKCGDPIFACADGKVTLAGLLGEAKVVRIAHPLFPGEETGYAHLAMILANIKVGVLVKRGQQIGTLGTTGASACHLHLGLKLNGTSIDIWPKLDQVIEERKHIAAAVAPVQAKVVATQGELDKANARIVAIKAKTAAFAVDIADE